MHKNKEQQEALIKIFRMLVSKGIYNLVTIIRCRRHKIFKERAVCKEFIIFSDTFNLPFVQKDNTITMLNS